MGVIEEYIRNSIAPKTWEEYSQAWFRWCKFCEEYNFAYNTVTVQMSLCFVSFLIKAKLVPASINKILAGVSFFLKMSGLPAINSFFPVRQMLKGFKKSSLALDSRRPISSNLLIQLMLTLELVCFCPFETLLFRTAFVLAFFGALRLGEFTAPNKSSPSILVFSDISVVDDSVRIFIRQSKMDRLGKGCWLTLHKAPFETICPVFRVSQYLSARPPVLGSFFIHLNLSPLTRYQFSSVLSSCLKQLNLSGLHFSSHSFRIGAATEASLLGFSNNGLKQLGRWDSDRFKLYIRPDLVIV